MGIGVRAADGLRSDKQPGVMGAVVSRIRTTRLQVVVPLICKDGEFLEACRDGDIRGARRLVYRAYAFLTPPLWGHCVLKTR
jgi:hypothetical protein